MRDDDMRPLVCKICDERHGSLVCDKALRLSEEIRNEAGDRDLKLRHKCRWEQMTRAAILKEYGDPAAWK